MKTNKPSPNAISENSSNSTQRGSNPSFRVKKKPPNPEIMYKGVMNLIIKANTNIQNFQDFLSNDKYSNIFNEGNKHNALDFLNALSDFDDQESDNSVASFLLKNSNGEKLLDIAEKQASHQKKVLINNIQKHDKNFNIHPDNAKKMNAYLNNKSNSQDSLKQALWNRLKSEHNDILAYSKKIQAGHSKISDIIKNQYTLPPEEQEKINLLLNSKSTDQSTQNSIEYNIDARSYQKPLSEEMKKVQKIEEIFEEVILLNFNKRILKKMYPDEQYKNNANDYVAAVLDKISQKQNEMPDYKETFEDTKEKFLEEIFKILS